MIPGPVFVAELRRTSRRARYYALRAGLAALLLFVAWMRFSQGGVGGGGIVAPEEASRLTADLSSALLVTQGAIVAAITPALVAGTIAEERKRKTLRDLLASDLTSGEIVLGKLGARLLHVGVYLAVGLPILSVMTLLGGVSPLDILAAYAATLGIALFLGGLSILTSTVSPSPRQAAFSAYLLAALFFAIGPMIQAVAAEAEIVLPDWVALLLLLTSPFAGSDRGAAGMTLMGGVLGALGLMLAGLGVLALRPSARRLGDGRAPARRRWRLWPRRAIGDSPMRWKETQLRPSPGCAALLARLAYAVLALWLVGWLVKGAILPWHEVSEFGYGRVGRHGMADRFNEDVRTAATCLYVVALLGLTATAAVSITSEREADTWTSLLASPLSPSEILRAKRAGALRRTRPMFFGVVAVWGLGTICGAVHPVGYVLGCLTLRVYRAAASALGVSLSLRCRSSARALGWSVGLTVLLHGGYLLLCLPLANGAVLATAGCSPFLIYLAPFSYGDLERFLQVQPRDSFAQRGGELALAWLFSVLLYAGLAALLNRMASADFDRLEDRPSGDGPSRRIQPPEPKDPRP